MKRIAACLVLSAVGCSIEAPPLAGEVPEVPGSPDAGAPVVGDDAGAEPGPDAAAMPPDAGEIPTPDAAPAPDADTRLAVAPSALPFVRATPPTVDVSSFVTGGTPPYECYMYEGVAPGTVPSEVWMEGCVLEGDVGEWDAPGVYGFTVTVVDAAGDEVDVHLVYEGEACDTAEVTMTPSAAGITGTAGTSREWRIDVSDLDALSSPVGCDACLTMSLLTRSPLQPSPQLACAEPGEVCSDSEGTITMHDTCPATNAATATRFVKLRDHAPVRGDVPGWVTVELNVNYSGASLNPCGGKSWSCHIEVLELP